MNVDVWRSDMAAFRRAIGSRDRQVVTDLQSRFPLSGRDRRVIGNALARLILEGETDAAIADSEYDFEDREVFAVASALIFIGAAIPKTLVAGNFPVSALDAVEEQLVHGGVSQATLSKWRYLSHGRAFDTGRGVRETGAEVWMGYLYSSEHTQLAEDLSRLRHSVAEGALPAIAERLLDSIAVSSLDPDHPELRDLVVVASDALPTGVSE